MEDGVYRWSPWHTRPPDWVGLILSHDAQPEKGCRNQKDPNVRYLTLQLIHWSGLQPFPSYSDKGPLSEAGL